MTTTFSEGGKQTNISNYADCTGIILGLYINVLSFLLKKLQGYAHQHEAFQVFGGVSSSYYLWSALLCIWLNVCGFPFMLFMALSELNPGSWGWTIITRTHINMHKPTRIQIIHNQRLLRSGGKRKRAFLCKV